MRVVLQRVSRASVTIDGRVAGTVGRGFCLLVGFTHGDTGDQVDWMAEKVAGLRLFSDAEGKMNLGLSEVQGGLLVISVPNVHSWDFKLFGRWWFPLDPPRHFYHFDRNSLSATLASAGFSTTMARTAVSSVFLMASLDRVWLHRFKTKVPLRKLIDGLLAGPLSFLAGRLGYGTELTIHAAKAPVRPDAQLSLR